MKIKLKIVGDYNIVNTYASIEDAETFLNHALYYCMSLQLSSSFDDFKDYDNDTDLVEMMDDAKRFGNGVIHCIPIYE